MGRLAVHHFFIHPSHQGAAQQCLALRGRDGANLAARWQHVGTLGDARAAFFVQAAHQGFTYSQFGNSRFNVQPGVGAHGAGCSFDGFLIARREGTQRVLYAVAQLRQHGVGNIQRVLRDKVHAHALGANQAHHQFNALDQHFRCLVEQQVGFVEEKHQFGLFWVANFRQGFKQLRQHPQQKSGVQPGRVHQLIGSQDVDHAVPLAVGLHEVLQVEHGLAKEFVAALLFNGQQAALDGAHAGRADIAVAGGEFFGVLAHVGQHGAQVFQVEQQQAVVVGNFEHQVEHASLRVVQVQHARQQQRAHV